MVDNNFIGEIRMFGGLFAPRGWTMCNGQLLSISENEALFALIGTTYGGDGISTFALPNLQSRVPVHMGQINGNGTTYTIGEMAGVESVTLVTGQMPAHNHPAGCNSVATGGTTADPTNNFWAGSPAFIQYSSNAPNSTLNQNALGLQGGNQPHDNMVPYLVVTFIIALEGIFPSQN